MLTYPMESRVDPRRAPAPAARGRFVLPRLEHVPRETECDTYLEELLCQKPPAQIWSDRSPEVEKEFSLTVHKDLEASAGLSWQMLVQVKPQLSARQRAG